MVNHYAGGPQYGMEFRPFYMAREWVRMGHRVLVVGATFSHLRKTQPKAGKEQLDGIDFLWLPTREYDGNGVARALSMYDFVRQLYCHMHELKSFNPNVVIASSVYTYDLWPCYKLARKCQAKLIYEVHDLWPLSPQVLGNYSKYHPFIWTLQRAEDFGYRKCDAVVSLLPKAEEHMRAHGLSEGKFHYVPNGIVADDWDETSPLPQPHQQLIQRLHDNGRFLVAYAGNHGIANSLYSAIDAIGPMDNEKVDLLLVGNGPEKERLKEYAKTKGFANIHFLDAIDKKAIPQLLAQMDLLYIGLQRHELFRYGISPNKMFDYMMAGKPILQAIEAGNNMVEEAQCGVCAMPEDACSIRESIRKIKSMSEEDRDNMGCNGHEYVMNNHTYKVLATRFINIMSRL